MFVKHSFGVKHFLPIPPIRPRPASVTPQEHTRDMTAALTFPDVTDLPPRLRLVPELAADAASPVEEPGTRRPRLPVAPEVYRRRRLGVLAVVAGLVVGAASFGQARASAPSEVVGTDAVVVVVQPGDTLWGIATALSPDREPRALVHELRGLVGAAPIEPGQQLVIPRSLVD